VEGVPLGLIPGVDYLQSALRLGPGNFLVLYTDGLTESTNDPGLELGYHGILNLAESLLLKQKPHVARSVKPEPSSSTGKGLIDTEYY